MSDLNSVTLMGRLTKNPELFYTNNDKAYAKFTLAVNGYNENDTSFIDCVIWNAPAENIHKYCSRGLRIAVEGFLKQQRWEKDGKKYNRLSVVASRFFFADGKKTDDNGKNKGSGRKESYPEDDYSFPEDSFNDPIPY
jgi:single-strand DNA-binding protein